LFLAKILTANTLDAHKIQGLTFKTVFTLIVPNSWENSGAALPKGHICPGEKKKSPSFFFFQ
jgi:hypothetical protein